MEFAEIKGTIARTVEGWVKGLDTRPKATRQEEPDGKAKNPQEEHKDQNTPLDSTPEAKPA